MIEPTTTFRPLPRVSALNLQDGLQALAHLRHGLSGILPVLEQLHRKSGDVFQLTLFNFYTVIVASPTLIRYILTIQCEAFMWRHEYDPVTSILRRSILVTDGAEHDCLPALKAPSSRRQHFLPHADRIVAVADRVINRWSAEGRILTLREMRTIALLIFEEISFSHTLTWGERDTRWSPTLRALACRTTGLSLRLVGINNLVVWSSVLVAFYSMTLNFTRRSRWKGRRVG